MKRFLLLLAAAALLLTAACGNTETPADVSFDEAALQEDAQQVADDLQKGEYAAVAVKFNEKMADAVSNEALAQGWEQTVADMGAYLERVSVMGAERDGYYAVDVLERFENSGVNVHVVYDGEGKIAGLRCTYADASSSEADASAPEQSDAYTETDITVAGDSTLPLGGTLTLPTGVEKPPVLILLQGSGSSDRNETYNANKPFADLAHGLAERGIATIRYDKRYYSYPDSGIALGAALTLDDEVLDDAYAAIALAQSDERVDGSRVFVLGHSLGGMLMPAIAYAKPELSGVISMAGTLRPLWEVSYDQNQEAIAAIDVTALSDSDKALMDTQVAQIEADITALRGDFSSLSDDTVLMGIPAGYWKSLKQYSGENFIDDISMPMLILQGDADFQVSPDKDYTLWQETLSGRDNVTFHLYEGLNHLMMPTQGKRDVTEYNVAGKVDSQVIDDIAAFISEN